MKYAIKNSLILVFNLLLFSANAQYTFPEKGYVFDDAEPPRIDIFIDSDSLQQLLDLDNLQENHEYPATFIFTKSNSLDTVENIGFRLRGNTSRGAGKKSFKVSFNRFISGQKFYDLEKMNLNGEHNDPSIMRSKLCWELCNWTEVPSARANHVALYINEEYKGLYLNVEHVDEEFIQKRLSDNSGNLYKCLYPADLHYKGEDPNLYKEEFWGRPAYQLKTNLDANDYSDLAHFIDVLNFWVGESFKCEMERIFDIDTYLKNIALDILTSNWDGPIVNKNNFYLYHDPCSDKLVYLPYDLDNTLGIDWFGVDWANTDIYNWSSNSNEFRPIFEKIMIVPEYRNRFSFYLEQIITNHFNSDLLEPYLSEKKNQLAPFRSPDTYAELDYGYNFVNFLQSFEEASGDHVTYGLTDYVTVRSESALDQIELVDIFPVVKNIAIDWSENEVNFDIATLDDGIVEQAIFRYKIGNQAWQNEVLTISNDTAAFTLTTSETETLTYYVELTDDIGQQSFYPRCQDGELLLGFHPTPNLVINEFMASNTNGVTDNFGEQEDWIEIYNAGNYPLQLSHFYLSDDRENTTKWKLPFQMLYPGEYEVFWADDDKEQGSNHCNFKLKKGGEFIGLFDKKNNHFSVIDSLTYSEQTSDVSSARSPNGTGIFEFDESPTFGYNNDLTIGVNAMLDFDIQLYPNPASEQLFIFSNNKNTYDLEAYDVNGRLLFSKENSDNLEVGHLENGVYFLKVEGQIKRFMILK
ncbi:MAG: spore coat protein H [Polaribacter sp.]|jgi:spore coat protein H